MQRLPRILATLLALLVAVGVAPSNARGQRSTPSDAAADIPILTPAPQLDGLLGKPIRRIEIIITGGRWRDSAQISRVKVGDPLSPVTARRALAELVDTGRFADVRAEVEPATGGVVLKLYALPRRIVTAVRVTGAALDDSDTLRAAELERGGDVTGPDLPRIAERVRSFYARHGYPKTRVVVDALDTDDPMRVVVRVAIEAGKPLRVGARRFHVSGGRKGLGPLLEGYAVDVDDRVDEEVLTAADQELAKLLRQRGWHDAMVRHWVVTDRRERSSAIHVIVEAGSRYALRFEGNRTFDASQLTLALDLEENEDRSVGRLERRLRDFYVARGFLDAQISARVRGERNRPVREILFTVRENAPVRVVAREFPCLSGSRSADDVGSEIDGFLSEELPGVGILGSVDPGLVDESFGPRHKTGARPPPYEPNPWQTYAPEIYGRAMKHLQDLYRSEGYLSATVGPAVVLRRRCRPDSPPGRCIPDGPPARPPTTCRKDSRGRPLPEPEGDAPAACTPDPRRGVRCEPGITLHIPVKLGPRTFLYDLAFEGNEAIVETELQEAAALKLGEPVSQPELERARRRVLELYAEEGFAYADADPLLDLSPDDSRARARFVISERERVIVSGIVIRGADRTSESLIRGRIALETGKPYRRSLVRATEERLATLGVFSSISVNLDNPNVPAKEKLVVVTLQERPPQYIDVGPGFGTGEGFRMTFEYGHRNLGGEAIQLTLRAQLSLLPSFLIFDRSTEAKIEALPLGERLERRLTASVEFPEVGLGPLFRLAVTGLEVNDLTRSFRVTKRAAFVTLIFRPNRRFSWRVGPSVELNDAEILGFDSADRDAFRVFLRTNPIPEGRSVAIAQLTGFTWDRRDKPFEATSGTFLDSSVEHVRAIPLGNSREKDSDFLRFSNRVAGYLPLDDEGLAVATSLRWGFIQHLIPNRQTYPDRLFFFGGIDTIRGFVQDSVVPEDVAQELLDETPERQSELLRDVVIPGGNVLINPRMELRIPLGDVLSTALFVDSGNLWLDPNEVDPTRLRYSAGSGLRAGTPIGPLVFDYGVNLDRRPWEDFGAFHFSLGLF